MLTHIVCWKYRADVSANDRAEHVRRLNTLPHLVPDIERFEAGPDVLHLERSYDTALIAVFRDRATLEAYDAHPEHRSVVAVGRAIAENVISVDMESVSQK